MTRPLAARAANGRLRWGSNHPARGLPGISAAATIARMSHPSRRPRTLMLAIVLVLLGFGLPAGVARAQPARTGEPVLRIAILTQADQADVTCDGELRVWRRGSGLAGSVLAAGARLSLRPLGQAASDSHADGEDPMRAGALELLDAGGKSLGVFTEEILFEPLAPGKPIRVQGKPYRGEILVRASRGPSLTVVNALRIEDYLRGVVPLEIGTNPGLPAAALEAQAIAARSYSLFYLGRRSATHGCDLLASAEDQVYGGLSAETDEASRAVEATRGLVAEYEGRAIRANYCSTCGGATETAERVWPGQKFAYLRGVKDRDGSGKPLCAASYAARWEERWECQQFAAAVLERLPEEVPEARGLALGRLRDIDVIHRSPSGRVETLAVVTDAGRFVVSGDRIRWVLRRPDGAPLRSTWFGKFRRDDDEDCRITLEGRGYGHGVGMCQWGALELARQGKRADEILRRYYRGIRLVRWW
jgi:stage II sporulation protein D